MSDDGLFEQLSVKLAAAHRRVRGLDLDGEQKARVTKRLLAISDAAKHDLARADGRLSAFLRDLDEGRVTAADGETSST